MKTNHFGWKRENLGVFSLLLNSEVEVYRDWRFNHKCLSSIEFIIKPDPVGQTVYVRCSMCGEEVDITDYASA